jgi:hypothetical protein
VFARFWRRTGKALLWLPLALPGLPLHLPAALLARALAPRLAPRRRDVVATSALLIGLAAVATAWLLVGGGLLWAFGARAAWLLPLLPLSGWATLRLLERYADGREVLLSLLNFIRFRSEVQSLRAERARIADAVLVIVERHLPADMAPLFLDAVRARTTSPSAPHATTTAE